MLEFIEFHKWTNTSHRLTLIDDMLNKLTITIPSSEIFIDDRQKPRVYFLLDLKSGETSFTLKKQYRDFKTLHLYLQNTFSSSDEQLYKLIPDLPSKYEQGKQKKSVGELSKELELFIRAVVTNSGFSNLLIVKNFLADGLQKEEPAKGGEEEEDEDYDPFTSVYNKI